MTNLFSRLAVLSGVLVLGALPACTVESDPYPPSYPTTYAPAPAPVQATEVVVAEPPPPPPPQPEVITVSPGPDQVWIGGYWGWSGRAYGWRPGHWEHRPHARANWETGHWERRGRGHVWVEGHWR